MSRSEAEPWPVVDGWWIKKRLSGSENRLFLSVANRIRIAADAQSPFTTVRTGADANSACEEHPEIRKIHVLFSRGNRPQRTRSGKVAPDNSVLGFLPRRRPFAHEGPALAAAEQEAQKPLGWAGESGAWGTESSCTTSCAAETGS